MLIMGCVMCHEVLPTYNSKYISTITSDIDLAVAAAKEYIRAATPRNSK